MDAVPEVGIAPVVHEASNGGHGRLASPVTAPVSGAIHARRAEAGALAHEGTEMLRHPSADAQPHRDARGDGFEGARAVAAVKPETVSLRDGTVILIRPIEPGDKEQLVRGFERLSLQSRYRRFLTPMSRLNSHLLRYFTEVDHHDHEALVAESAFGADPVGVARYIRLADNPGTAEVAIAVVDDWQGKGAGTALLRSLAARAGEEGVERFSATCLATNNDVLDLLEVIAPTQVRSMEDGLVEVEVALPARDQDSLRAALRRAASGALSFRHPLEHS